ncbi:Zn(2)-C6 fungal-type domain-containing protein [Lachancea thermotolerans]
MAKIRYRSVRKHPKDDGFVKHTEKRSKSGCFTCRHRRKKCDEVRPRCGGCTRNMLDCSWPSFFINEYSPILGNKEKDPNSKFSFVHVPQKDLKKPQLNEPKPAAKTPAPRALVTFSSLLQLTDSIPHEAEVSRKHYSKRNLSGENSALVNSKKTAITEIELACNSEVKSKENTEVSDPRNNGVLNDREYSSGDANRVELQLENSRTYKDYFDLQLTPFFYFEVSQFEESPRGFSTALSKHKHELSNKKRNSIQNEKNRTPEKPFASSRDGNLEANECGDAGKYSKILENYDRGEPSVNINIENDEALLLYACVEKFIPNLGTQYTHPLLTACATFVPQAENSIPLREVFMCCGATYLEWYDDVKFVPLSNSLYKSSQLLIEKYLHDESLTDAGPWLLASFQLLCLRSKMASSGSVDDCVQCLSKSYLVIQNTILMRNNKHIHTSVGLQNLAYEIENKFMRQPEQKEQEENLSTQPYERMYIESFIYNYSVTILFATNISRLPSPFCIFKEISHVLKRPLYCCHFEWMNNPVLGPALDAFEILAKVSYIGRLPMPLEKSSVWFQRARLLETMAFFYTGPVLSLQVKSNDKQLFEKAKLSAVVGTIVAKSSYLLVSKVLKFEEFQIQHATIQKVRFEIFEAFSSIPLENNIWGILLWSLVVTGCFSTTIHERSCTLRYLLNVGERFHHQSTIKMRKFLEKAWSRPIEKRLDILFDRQELSKIAP